MTPSKVNAINFKSICPITCAILKKKRTLNQKKPPLSLVFQGFLLGNPFYSESSLLGWNPMKLPIEKPIPLHENISSSISSKKMVRATIKAMVYINDFQNIVTFFCVSGLFSWDSFRRNTKIKMRDNFGNVISTDNCVQGLFKSRH